MQNQEKKGSVNVPNIKQMVKDELYKSKYVKTAIYVFGGVLGLFALGFVFKAVNYTAYNFKNLNATLKR
ncbi:hypothetical protein [Flavobacterium myungsuense]|uniref:Uncharacterized protein n=2 Tax=Flavobacterium myungsuense TaxID=651823 RepID=A0ABW3J0J5_9FLAO